MNPKLIALLVTVGPTAGGLVLFTPSNNVTRGELLDAGIAEGTPTTFSCPARLSDERVAALQDAGFPGRRYRTLNLRARSFDGIAVVADIPRGIELFRPDLCKTPDSGTLPDEGDVRPTFERCACRGASGTCRWRMLDGGLETAPFGITLRESEWRGAGCIRKACGEIAGESSWPNDECPDRDAGL